MSIHASHRYLQQLSETAPAPMAYLNLLQPFQSPNATRNLLAFATQKVSKTGIRLKALLE